MQLQIKQSRITYNICFIGCTNDTEIEGLIYTFSVSVRIITSLKSAVHLTDSLRDMDFSILDLLSHLRALTVFHGDRLDRTGLHVRGYDWSPSDITPVALPSLRSGHGDVFRGAAA